MKNLAYKIGTGIASAALVASAFAPAIFAADGDITISNNGADSKNNVEVTKTCAINVTQSNDSNVDVDLRVKAKTGGNEASGNTGGGVTISTGAATSLATVVVSGLTNDLIMPSCCECQTGGTTVTIDNNGAGSNNKVKDTSSQIQGATQTNKSKVKVKAKVKAKTGKNKANNNTGGTTGITTGPAGSTTDVTVNAPSNIF